MKNVYPVILTPAEHGYVVYVPDFDINTEGKDAADAVDMARDAIGLCGICRQDAGEKIPSCAVLNPKHNEQELIALVDIDFAAYRRANDNRTVRKNVTLPSWLASKAEDAGVNFSQILQEGIKEKLHLAE